MFFLSLHAVLLLSFVFNYLWLLCENARYSGGQNLESLSSPTECARKQYFQLAFPFWPNESQIHLAQEGRSYNQIKKRANSSNIYSALKTETSTTEL